MKHYTQSDLRTLYDEVPPELQDRVSRTLAGLPEKDRQNAGMSRKVWICLAAAMVLLVGLTTAGFATGTIQRWLYTYQYTVLEDGSAEIWRYNGNEETVAVPEEIDGHPVTAIGNRAFYQCHFLKEVMIPEGVTGIGSLAFAECTHLESVSIPDSVTMINSYAFVFCESLTEVQIPDSVDLIGFGAFGNCSSLRNVRLPEKTAVLYREVFSYCRSLENIVIPESVTVIGDNAFAFCESLTDITLPEGLTEIGQYAFGECTGLRQVTIPRSVKEIHRYAFLGCSRDLRLIVAKDSYAAEYCRENGLTYKELPEMKNVQPATGND